ncbi:hypothetical protein [Aequorivita marina]|uniref:hypothetical protein n=1 Tax=Aequorivita marina TaxID=3073654 RepID=UPI002875FC3F|nr:hypothetical protein [Aequorivita sp. S2608]MDS1298066.1 hypothetical protein [Aequorivita sp. S2608]
MKNLYINRGALFFTLFFIFFFYSAIAQVGIGTTNPNANAKLDITSTVAEPGGLLLPRVKLLSTISASPLTAHVEGMTIYNTATIGDVRPGQYYNNGSRWIRIAGADPVESVSLSTDQTISNTSFTPISGMTLQFTARKSSVLVVLTSSGLGEEDAMSYINLRVVKTSPGGFELIGGTMNKIQNYDTFTFLGVPFSDTSPEWSASFSKLYTGLAIGTTYTLRVDGMVDGILGTYSTNINAASKPVRNHLTLSVIQ